EQSNVQSTIRREDISVDKGTAQDVQISQGIGTTPGGTEAVGAATTPGEESRGAATGTTPGVASGAITDLNTLAQTTDAHALSGRNVQLSSAKVQEIIDPHLISVGTDASQSRVYVYLPQPIENLKVGDKVTLTGSVKEPSMLTSANAALGSEVSQKLKSQP